MKIYDCFCFFNELDILEMRLNILYPYVDYFIISEASVTHNGQPKQFFFEENKERYSKFIDKIIHLKITDTPDQFVDLPIKSNPETFDDKCLNDIWSYVLVTPNFNRYNQPHYGRDFFQKECIRRGMEHCQDDDIIISSDCDEIPNPKIFENIGDLKDDKFYTCNQNTYYYYLNILKEKNWKGSRIGRYKNLKNYSYNLLRTQINDDIVDGGWHFSFMGGPDKVKTKIQSYSAQEFNNDYYLNSISSNINNNVDPFFRGMLDVVNIDETYPKYLLENLNKYSHMIKK